MTYLDRRKTEERFFSACESVHVLPPIFHYWSDKYIRPKLRAIGFDGVKEFFRDSLLRQLNGSNEGTARFLSVGSGNCELEIQLAVELTTAAGRAFTIDCLELSQTALDRAMHGARNAGVSDHLRMVCADINEWKPTGSYNAVMAVESLHHIVNLEGLFAAIEKSLTPSGVFVIADTIGRNGHLRWPEALAIVHEFWPRLPPSYRFNQQLKRYEEWYLDWDCSQEGFEGVRAQDILPLLGEMFDFEHFIPYGNVIDPFVDRAFGHNFDASASWDRELIDEIHARDEAALASGRLSPTHMFGILRCKNANCLARTAALNPTRYIRPVEYRPTFEPLDEKQRKPYDWGSYPNPARELAFVGQQLSASEAQAAALRQEVESLSKLLSDKHREFDERTAWALRLDQELREARAWGWKLEADLEERTAWALSLQRELEEQTKAVEELRSSR